jgi:hypothetical protein
MNASRYLSYLDLMCCGFGGAVLMFLIVASSRPEQRPTDQILVVRCRTDWERAGKGSGQSELPLARAEVGIEYRRAGDLAWRRGRQGEGAGEASVFAAPSRDGSGTETVMVWRQPTRGRWEFRPYLVDFPTMNRRSVGQTAPSDGREPTTVPVKLEVLGRRLRLEGESASQLRLPGETGATLQVDLL